MTKEPEIRQEIADERRELKDAVDSLRGEVAGTVERGKKVGVAVGAATSVALVSRLLLRLKRR